VEAEEASDYSEYVNGHGVVVMPVDEFERRLAASFRKGYNDHARSRAYAEAVYGKYPQGNGWPDSPTVHYLGGDGNVQTWNQHGKGENP
jgi:hypothetical protein